MPIVTMTPAFVAVAECQRGKRKTDYYEVHHTGFVLEVRANGGRTFYYRFTDANGRQRQTKIGDAHAITLAAAKRKYQQLKAQVTIGEDPLAEKKRKRSVPLYRELAAQHIAHAKTHQKRPENTAAVIEKHLVPRWGKEPLDRITPQVLAPWAGDMRKRYAPATVGKILVTLGRSFELARQWGVPGAEVNPVRSVPRVRFDNARKRYLTAEEAERLVLCADRSINPLLGAIVRLLLLTGARKSELLQARWEHVDLGRRSWFIPDSKTGRARHVPLSSEAVRVFEGIPHVSEHVFANPRTGRAYTCIKHPWETARKAAGLEGFRIHDARHAAASFLVGAGVDLFAVGRILGHADHQSTMRYAHLANDTLLAAVEAGAAKMKEGAGQ